MKPDIHPKYHQAKVTCGTCHTAFEVGSTSETLHVDVCSNCHPVLHGQADDRGHRRPGRALPEASRACGTGLSHIAIEMAAGPIGSAVLIRGPRPTGEPR